MKRILSILLAVTMTFGALSVTSLAAEKKQGASLVTSDDDIISVVGLLDIMVGDGNGNLNLDSELTRAQFVKMTVNASVYKNSVNIGTAYNPFPDVRESHWASPYVHAASSAKLVNGYLDGTFRPDNKVKLEEAATIALRLLGYTSSDLTGNYPDAQLAKFAELGLDAKVSAKKGENITRRDCMYIIYNLLSAETKDGAIYCTTLGYATASDGRIDRAALTDSKIDGSFVYIDTLSDGGMTFDVSNAKVYRDNVLTDSSAIKKYDYVRYSNSARTLWCYSDKVIGCVVSISAAGGSAASVIIGKNSYGVTGAEAAYAFSAVGGLKKDDVVMAVLDSNGGIFAAYPATAELIDEFADDDTDIAGVIDGTLKGPFVYDGTDSWKKELAHPIEDYELVYKSDFKTPITLDTLAKDDVIYYSNHFKRMYIYRKTATGTLSETTAGKTVSTVSLSCGAYALATDAAKKKLYNGVYKKDDFVTVLLGRNSEVVDIIDGDISRLNTDDTDGDTDVVSVIEATLKGPFLYDGTDSWRKELAYAPSEYEVTYESDDNVKITLDTLEKKDVIYYSNPFKRIYIYRKTVVGTLGSVAMSTVQTSGGVASTYESNTVSTSSGAANANVNANANVTANGGVSSSSSYSSSSSSTNVSTSVSSSVSYGGGIASVGSIVVSGKSYSAATDKVKTMLYNGVYKKDDFVTLILGKNNGVVDIIDGDITKILYDDDDTDILGIMEATVKGPIVVGNDGSWKNSIPFDLDSANVVTAGTSKVKIGLSEIKENDIVYYSVPFNAIYVYRDTVTGVVKEISYASGMPSAVTVGNSFYYLGANIIKIKLYNGEYRKDDFVTLLLGKDGKAIDARSATAEDITKYSEGSSKYSEILEASMSEPIVVTEENADWQSEIPFDLSEAKFYKDNAEIKKSDVGLYSVIYYCAPLKAVWVYDDSVTGIYESASPSRMSPTSVVISGAAYAIEADEVTVAFSNLGDYKLGDSVTVLLGRNGGVVKVLSASETKTENIAVVTNVEDDRVFTDGDGIVTTHDAVTVVFTNGKTATYKYNTRSFESGDLVKVTVDKGEVTIIGTGSKYNSGSAATVTKLLQSGKVDDNAKIIDVYCSSTLRVYPAVLTNVTLTAKDILYYELDSDGELATLLLNDFTGDMHSYMFMTGKTVAGSATALYEGYMNGVKTAVSGDNFANTNPDNVSGVVVKYDGTSVNRVSAINEARVKLSDITANSCIIDGTEFAIRNDAYFYVYDSDTSDYVEVKAKKFLEGSYNTIRAFYDRTPERGGKVRFIVAR